MLSADGLSAFSFEMQKIANKAVIYAKMHYESFLYRKDAGAVVATMYRYLTPCC